ncbi:hypothetical protein VaNZ11_009653 [Volvox africanus]|uniref:Uncharacterized protein n=1 Tax=Volvox africanus TaxID=51714 RepID=A0ABQ5S7T0_9CHLO|nr:hypothetical protein VaNZ11_009653 [Volvox africanus]
MLCMMEVTFWDKAWLVSIGVVSCLVTIFLIATSHRLQHRGHLVLETSEPEAQAPRAAVIPQKAAPQQTEQTGRSSAPQLKDERLPQVKEEEVATPVLQVVKGLKDAGPHRTSRFANQMVAAT